MGTQSPPTASAGLVGLVQRLTKRASDGFDQSIVRIFAMMVVGAAVIAVIEYTITKAPTGLGFWKLLLLGLGAILAELMGIHRIILAWHAAKPGSMAAWAGVWILGFSFSVYNAMGSASEFQAKRESLQQASHNAYNDNRAALNAAKSKRDSDAKAVDDLRKLTWEAIPVVAGVQITSPAQAQALIDKARANTRFWTMTEGCQKTAGAQTRAFCSEHAAAVAALAAATAREDNAEKLIAAERALAASEAKYEAAQRAASDTKVVKGEHTPFVQSVSYFTGAKPDEIAWVEPVQTSLVNMLLVSFAGLVLGLAAIQGRERTKWFDFSKLKRLLFGGESPVAPAAPAAAVVASPPAIAAAALSPPVEATPALSPPAPTTNTTTHITVVDDDVAKRIVEMCKGIGQARVAA